MSYKRVIPRDLFNEANLLKCYGQIYIKLETAGMPHVELEHVGQTFDVEQDWASGGLTVSNVVLRVGGEPVRLMRPSNSREPWPLLMIDLEDEETPVFDKDGNFSPEMLAFFESSAPEQHRIDSARGEG